MQFLRRLVKQADRIQCEARPEGPQQRRPQDYGRRLGKQFRAGPVESFHVFPLQFRLARFRPAAGLNSGHHQRDDQQADQSDHIQAMSHREGEERVNEEPVQACGGQHGNDGGLPKPAVQRLQNDRDQEQQGRRRRIEVDSITDRRDGGD